MPEGISLDMEGDEEECSVGPVSRLDIVPSYDAVSFAGVPVFISVGIGFLSREGRKKIYLFDNKTVNMYILVLSSMCRSICIYKHPFLLQSFTGILTDVEYNMETGKKINDALPKMCCFNCLGDHNVSDCPKPQDMQRIAANRKKHNVTRVPNV